jgi:hypothetical protein
MRTLVEAELEFSVSTADGRTMSGSLTGSGNRLSLVVTDPRLLGGSGTGPARALAAQLARHGLQLSVETDRPLVTLGERAPFWQRRFTGSPYIRVASLAAALRLLRLRRASPRRTPLVPPGTPLPVAPTFLRRPRRPTTTHDPDGGGYPRLVPAPDPHRRAELPEVHHLGDRTVLGSHPSCDVVLPGLAAQHAEVVRRDDDEFVVRPLAPGSGVRVHGAVVLREGLLRTGTRVELGPWTLTYVRDEHADHGRPYGGRIGGELGRQRPQPPREQLMRPRQDIGRDKAHHHGRNG